MKMRIVTGLFAHVDAGKTTLAERLLYMNGALSDPGRVDRGDAFLDTDEFEKERGITMYSKQARFTSGDTEFILVDTPGHNDLAPETERVLWITDAAILLISAQEGITPHTRRLWKLLESYSIPVIFFINKTDMPGKAVADILEEIRTRLSSSAAFYSRNTADGFLEEAALSDEGLLDKYLEGKMPDDKEISSLVSKRLLFPCCAGSALIGDGVDELMDCLERFVKAPEYDSSFGARVYKVSRDEKGNRLIWLKVTGGSLKVKDHLSENEKADELRLYSGAGHSQVPEVLSGDICAVKGASSIPAGCGLGFERPAPLPVTVPVLAYEVECDDALREKDLKAAIEKLAEEEPLLMPKDAGTGGNITVHASGNIQLEILKHTLAERFGLNVRFREQEIVYKETIAGKVIGVGHFEPLRHYAEVHLLLEPMEKGSGIIIENICSRDDLEPHWQKLIISHLYEKKFKGVLTGSELTDVRITLLKGRSHLKHTESGDFRQAVFRAVRQGLMEAESILLEPVLKFELEIPEENIGKALADLTAFGALTDPPEIENGTAFMKGTCPASAIRNYQKEVVSYTSGQGEISLMFAGYSPCKDPGEIIGKIGYDPDRDVDEPSSSVFCSHGAGIIVPWNEVKDRMHLEDDYDLTRDEEEYENDDFYERQQIPVQKSARELTFGEREAMILAGETELSDIFNRTYKKNDRPVPKYRKRKVSINELGEREKTKKSSQRIKPGKEILIVDGYNIIFAWPDLKKLAEKNIDSARDSLIDMLSDYQGTRDGETIVVFDAYKVPGMKGEDSEYYNIRVVYTKEDETADKYIERLVNEKGRDSNIRVATSDSLIQTMILGDGAARMSASELLHEVARTKKEIKDLYRAPVIKARVNMLDDISDELRKEFEGLEEE